jgi:hypothetical protein
VSRKKVPFILDIHIGPEARAALPRPGKSTVEYGLPRHAPDNPEILDLCQREEGMLVTADVGFREHVKAWQKAHNDCAWGMILLPSEDLKAAAVLKSWQDGKVKLYHPRDGDELHYDLARGSNLLIDFRVDPPKVTELCDCPWD